MSEAEPRSPFESFQALQRVQAELERQGDYFYPIEKEIAEGLITGPLLRRVRTDIKKRGFAKLAGRVAIPPLHGFHGHRFGGMMPRQGGIHEPVSLQL